MGLRRILALPRAYEIFGRLLGAERGRATFVREYVRPRSGDRILDIGCGPALILEHLAQVEYVGFDSSAEYVESARRRFGDRGQFFNKMIGRDEIAGFAGFDVALALGIVHHLHEEEAHQLMVLARSALKPTGRLIALDGCFCENQSRFVRFMLSRDRGRHVRTEDGYRTLAKAVFPNVRTWVRNDLLCVPYTHIIMECSG